MTTSVASEAQARRLSWAVCNVPEGWDGGWRVEHFKVSEEESAFTRMRAAAGHSHEYVPPGSYTRLLRHHVVVMSNTPTEYWTNQPFIGRATGLCLINGLGLGMTLKLALENPDVKQVVVVEKSAEVIKLVAPTYTGDKRVVIAHADAFEFDPGKGTEYDVVWHDIWDNICSDNLKDMHRLHRRYGRRAKWQGSWCRAQCERALRRASYW